MKKIQKISDISTDDIAGYLKIDDPDTEELQELENYLNVAKTYIKNYTGRTDEEVDKFPEFVIVAFVLIQDMYDNRTLYVGNTGINTVVENILGMHSVNLL